MAETIRLTGFRELHDALGLLPKATERNVLRRAAVKALEPFVERAKELAPVDDGDLRDSITIGSKLTDRARRADKKRPKNGVRVFAGTANRNGVPREFGGKDPAHPFMRPAWAATQGEVLESVRDDIVREIDKAAARAARKARR